LKNGEICMRRFGNSFKGHLRDSGECCRVYI
jgi:hypothetical protein